MSITDSSLSNMLDLFALDSQRSSISADTTSNLDNSRKASDVAIPSIEAPVLRNKSGKPRKLRASCDACSNAKVKCSKEHPICQRCVNNNSTCHYSPSMRLGKPRAKPKDPNAPSPDALSHAKTNAGIKKARKRADSYTVAKPTTLTKASKFEDTSELPLFGNLDTPFCDSSLSNELDNFLDASIYSDPFSELNKSLQDPGPDILSLAGPVNLPTVDSTPNIFHHGHSPLDLPLPALSDDSDDEFSSAFNSSIGTPTSTRSSISDISPTPESVFGQPTPKPHDCTALAFSTLSELSTLSGAPFTNATEFDELVMLDALLTICQTGIDNVSAILDCPCSRHPHFSTTIAFIVIKVLSWYQTLSGLAQGLPPFSFDGELNSASTLRSQSIRWELRRIERLIDEFPNRFRTRSDAGSEVDMNVYVHLQGMLRTKLRETLECTMQRIR